MLRSFLAGLTLAVGSLAYGTTGASAGGWGYDYSGYYPPPVYYAPPVVYVVPPPVYRPPPFYYAPPVVYYGRRARVVRSYPPAPLYGYPVPARVFDPYYAGYRWAGYRWRRW